ncbi:serine/threonine-protein phosphatase 7 long form homolog [Asparagus officinalis]|uniref:serine/threonine-protein phosphatase 7 long form homolog n=1 Tax=Asparagus officinalis TaxID=4686 RepID=UPI00098E5075|nr:serine/threonine-protein phosphatase 7 long form homolog [Asparagus officinalis]
MDPGPVSDEVLYDQAQHRSHIISCTERGPSIVMVDHSLSHSRWRLEDERIIAAVGRAGFLTCSKLRWIKLDWPLLIALMDRWRPETNTFHFRMGEATITLQDVSVILGLRIDGPCITGTDSDVWPRRCEELLGVAPETMPRGTIKLKWLRETFSVPLPVDAPQILVDQHARAYIMHMIGTILFPDSSKDKVHARWLPLLEDLDVCGTKSWGSAVLAYLYREMSKVALMQNSELKGCLSLLQVWAWERLHLKPRLCTHLQLDGQIPLGCRWNVEKCYDETPARQLDFYRNELDRMKIFQMEWESYTQFLPQLPPICTEYQVVWRARVPLICLEIVEMHVPDRVLRQYGLAQHVPQFVEKIERKAKKGGQQINWMIVHQAFIHKWNDRHFCIVNQIEPTPRESDYYTWYWDITQRWILHSTTIPVESQRGYVPRGIDKRELVSAIDEVQTLVNRGLELARAGYNAEASTIVMMDGRYCHSYIHDNSDIVEDDAEMTMKLDLPNVSTMELDRHNHKRNRITNSSKGGMEDDEDKGGGEFLDWEFVV